MTQKAPPPVQRDVPKDLDNKDLLNFFTRNRTLLIGSIIALVAVVIFGITIVNHYEEKDDTGWNELTESARPIPISTVPLLFVNSEALEESFNAEDTIKGTSAEPWALYLLSLQELKDGETEKAYKHFQDLQDRFGDHYVCQNDYLGKTLQQKLSAERDWLAKHPFKEEPDPVKEENPETEDLEESGSSDEETPEGEPTEDPAAGENPK